MHTLKIYCWSVVTSWRGPSILTWIWIQLILGKKTRRMFREMDYTSFQKSSASNLYSVLRLWYRLLPRQTKWRHQVSWDSFNDSRPRQWSYTTLCSLRSESFLLVHLTVHSVRSKTTFSQLHRSFRRHYTGSRTRSSLTCRFLKWPFLKTKLVSLPESLIQCSCRTNVVMTWAAE